MTQRRPPLVAVACDCALLAGEYLFTGPNLRQGAAQTSPFRNWQRGAASGAARLALAARLLAEAEAWIWATPSSAAPSGSPASRSRASASVSWHGYNQRRAASTAPAHLNGTSPGRSTPPPAAPPTRLIRLRAGSRTAHGATTTLTLHASLGESALAPATTTATTTTATTTAKKPHQKDISPRRPARPRAAVADRDDYPATSTEAPAASGATPMSGRVRPSASRRNPLTAAPASIPPIPARSALSLAFSHRFIIAS